MTNKGRRPVQIVLILALLFILVRTALYLLLLDVEEVTGPPYLGEPSPTSVAVTPHSLIPTPTPPLPSQAPEAFSDEWWSQFWAGFHAPTLWGETLISALLGVLTAILGALLKAGLPPLAAAIRRSVRLIRESIPLALRDFLKSMQVTIRDSVARVADSIANMTVVGEALVKVIGLALDGMGSLLSTLWLLVAREVVALWQKVRAPKWYEKRGAVDPGLIEVSLAVTAVIVALPGLRLGADAGSDPTFRFSLFRVIVEFVPIAVSIKLIDLYARDKGSKSLHVLVSPVEDGPFFFLSWAVLAGFLVIAAATLGLFVG